MLVHYWKRILNGTKRERWNVHERWYSNLNTTLRGRLRSISSPTYVFSLSEKIHMISGPTTDKNATEILKINRNVVNA